MCAQAARHHGSHVELLALTGGGAVNDDPAEFAAASQAFGSMLASEHFKDRVNALAVGELLDAHFIIDILVVDGVIKTQLPDAFQLFGGRSRAIGFDAKQLADLHGGCSHSSGDGVNQHSALPFAFDVHRLNGV